MMRFFTIGLFALASAAQAQNVPQCPLCASGALRQAAYAAMYAPSGPCRAPPTSIPSSGGHTWYFASTTASPAGNDTTGDGSAAAPWNDLNTLWRGGIVSGQNARLASVYSGGPVHAGDLVLIQDSGRFPYMQPANNAGLSATDWVTIAAAPGQTPTFPQLLINNSNIANLIFMGLTIDRSSGTVGGGNQDVFIGADSNIMLLNNKVRSVTDATYAAFTTGSQLGALAGGAGITGANCITDISDYRNTADTNNIATYLVQHTTNFAFGGTIDGYANDGMHFDDQITNAMVIGAGIFNSNSVNGNHNDLIQFTTTNGESFFDFLSIQVAWVNAVRDTGAGRVNFNVNSGTQGLDTDGATVGAGNITIRNNRITISGQATAIGIATGTWGAYVDRNIVRDDDELLNNGNTPAEINLYSNPNTTVNVTNNNSTGYGGPGGPVTVSGNTCFPAPADRNACSTGGF